MIKFYKKSVIDLDNTLPVLTVTDSVATNTGSDFTDFLRNRRNSSGWATTGSSDAGNTQILIEFNDLKEFNRIMLVQHNFKNFLLEYRDVADSWQTIQNVTNNIDATNYFEFSLVEGSAVRLTITATQVVDSDKFLRQFIICEELGRFTIEPQITAQFSKERKVNRYLSGKSFVATQVGGFSCRINKSGVFTEQDLALIETLFDQFDGFLVSLTGGDTTPYETIRAGYRLRDIFYMQLSNEYEPNWDDGRYKNGMTIDLRLVEVN